MVVDGRESKGYDHIKKDSLIFSADSKRLAFVAERNFKSLAVVDGVEA